MAVSSEFSSLSWITNLEFFKAQLSAGQVTRKQIDECIKADYADKVFQGLQQFYYWNKRFQIEEETPVVITLTMLSSDGLIKPNVKKIRSIIVSATGKGAIQGINYPENSNFVSFIMSNKEVALKAKKSVFEIDGALACYVEKRAHNTFFAKILWTPLFYSIDGIKKSLSQWCNEINIKFENEVFEDGEMIVTNKAAGLITLREGISLQQLPHVVKLCDTNNKYILISIRERPPLCLKCHCEGHIRKFCKKIKCKKCGFLHEVIEECVLKTFASILERKTTLEMEDVVNRDNSFSLTDNSNAKDIHLDLDNLTTGNNSDFQLITRKRSGKRSFPMDDTKSPKEGTFLNIEGHIVKNKNFFVLTDEMESCAKDKENVPDATSDIFEFKKKIRKNEMDLETCTLEEAEQTYNVSDGVGVTTRSVAKASENKLGEKVKSQNGDMEVAAYQTKTDIQEHKAEKLNAEINSSEDSLEDTLVSNEVCSTTEDETEETFEIELSGFPNKKKIKQIYEFLGKYTPIQAWSNRDDEDKPDGTFGAAYNTEAEARDALILHGQYFLNKKISVVYCD